MSGDGSRMHTWHFYGGLETDCYIRYMSGGVLFTLYYWVIQIFTNTFTWKKKKSRIITVLSEGSPTGESPGRVEH